ncbi:hypothetical protein NDU88_000952 [Pleurodeles waltl]|uniref:Uncharacterized protein n=1 Tax=Pleurodeles waltl TaxID=8319 RepID=A0AAV7SXW7_PLEWA|nr:hypothetical protein NDU88_000952 [Pleurodeles waltl]
MPRVLTSPIPLNGGYRPYTAGDCCGGVPFGGNRSKDLQPDSGLYLYTGRYRRFRKTATDLDRCLSIVEDQVAVLPNQETELRSLRAKVTDLEDRSRRDNVRFFGIPEYKEGSDIKTFLKNILPKITGLVFSPPLEFQRAHRIGSMHKATLDKPRPIIVCFLHHEQAHQIILAAKSQGPFSLEGHEIRSGEHQCDVIALLYYYVIQ